MTSGRLLHVNVGQARPLLVGERRMMSAIGKQTTKGAVEVQPLGLVGDEQADLSVHGGLTKAVYAYPCEHYAFWQQQRQRHCVTLFDEMLGAGFVGENLTLAGLLERDVWVGDELHFPDCVLRVTAPREPCAKFNAVMGYPQAARDMVQSGHCGFYLAVSTPGKLAADDRFELVPGRRALSIAQALAAKGAKHLR
jgi:MOSC domain-containing protein YiiM